MRRALLIALLAALLVVGMVAGAAFAGEVSGPPGEAGAEGEPTPIAGFWSGDGAASICSFSGLNDEITDDEPTQTQSYGTFLAYIMKTFDLSVKQAKEALGESPGHACNPNRAPWGNPKK